MRSHRARDAEHARHLYAIGATDAVPDAAKQDFSIVPPSTWLVDHVPWTEAEHRISAGNADKALADELKRSFMTDGGHAVTVGARAGAACAKRAN